MFGVRRHQLACFGNSAGETGCNYRSDAVHDRLEAMDLLLGVGVPLAGVVEPVLDGISNLAVARQENGVLLGGG